MTKGESKREIESFIDSVIASGYVWSDTSGLGHDAAQLRKTASPALLQKGLRSWIRQKFVLGKHRRAWNVRRKGANQAGALSVVGAYDRIVLSGTEGGHSGIDGGLLVARQQWRDQKKWEKSSNG